MLEYKAPILAANYQISEKCTAFPFFNKQQTIKACEVVRRLLREKNNPEDRIKILIEAASIVLPKLGNLQKARSVFNSKHKFLSFKDRFNRKKCLSCLSNYSEVRHHIIPLSNGGVNHRINVLTICNSCHVKIHPWLSEKQFNSVSWRGNGGFKWSKSVKNREPVITGSGILTQKPGENGNGVSPGNP